MTRPELRVEYVARDGIDELRKKIARDGTHRLVSVVRDGADYRVTLEALPEPPVEVR